MKKIMFSGLSPDITESQLREGLERFGTVARVSIIRDGDASHPVAIVEMPITDQAAFALTTRLTDVWHDGQRVNARILLH